MSSQKSKEELAAAKEDARKCAQYAAADIEQDDDNDDVDTDDDTERMRKSEYADVDNTFGNDLAD